MKHVILAADDNDMRAVLAEHLRRAGCCIHEARHGASALKLYEQNPGAIVVLDMVMPGMDGVETLFAFARFHSEARILAISGGGRIDGLNCLSLAKSRSERDPRQAI